MLISTSVIGDGLNKTDMTNHHCFTMGVDQKDSINHWEIINDSVMGGISAGNTQIENQTLVFSGYLSTENSGGFTSTYCTIPKLSEEIESVSIRIKGDGNRYQLRMRSQVLDSEVVYKIEFDTQQNKEETLTFRLDDFKASFRGRVLNNMPVLKANTISQVGFLIVTKRSLNFTLSAYAVEFF